MPNQSISKLFWLVAGVVCLFFLGGSWLNLATSLASVMPYRDDVQQDYLIAVAWGIILGCGILFWPVRQEYKKPLLAAWAFKLATSLGAMLFVEAYYRWLDSYSYFFVPKEAGYVFEGISFSGTENVYSLCWLHQQLMPDSYHALKVSFGMIGLVGIFVLYKTAVLLLGREDIRVFFAILLCPSVLYWSSFLGKEPLIFLGVAIHFHGVVGWQTQKRTGHLVAAALGCLLASLVRWWYGPILLLPLTVFIMRDRSNLPIKIFLAFTLLGVTAAAVSYFCESYGIGETADLYAEAGNQTANFGEGGSANEAVVFTGMKDLIVFLPLGMFTAFFRPLLGEVLNPLGLLAGLENMILLGLACVALYRLRWQKLQNVLTVWAIALLFVWGCLYSVISYGNLGTAVRYRLPILPVLMGLMAYLARQPGSDSRQKAGGGGSAANRWQPMPLRLPANVSCQGSSR